MESVTVESINKNVTLCFQTDFGHPLHPLACALNNALLNLSWLVIPYLISVLFEQQA
jgi:hypothetical protein